MSKDTTNIVLTSSVKKGDAFLKLKKGEFSLSITLNKGGYIMINDIYVEHAPGLVDAFERFLTDTGYLKEEVGANG